MAFVPKLDWVDDPSAPATAEGMTPITAAELIRIETGIAEAHEPAWGAIADKPTTFAPVIGAGATQAVAGNDPRLTAGAAGTATVRALGTGATQAAAGNHAHNATAITATAVAGGTATTVQGILAELAARIAAVEAG